MRIFIFISILILIGTPVFSQKTAADKIKEYKILYARDFGIVPELKKDIAPDLIRMLDTARKYRNVRIEFEKGTYEIHPEYAAKRIYYISNTSSKRECPSKLKTIALLIDSFNDLTLNGNGSLFIIYGKMINLAIVNSKNITVKNLSFDYQRPTMSEMTFEKISDTEITVKINPSSTYRITDGKIEFYGDGWRMSHYHAILVDPEFSAFYYSKFTPLLRSKATEIAPFTVKFTGNFARTDYKTGQTLTVRDPVRDQVGAFLAYSKDITLHKVNMHYMHGMGVISQFTENITLDHVNVEPRKETGRKIAAFADCFHFSGCRGQITIKNCRTSGAHDDAVNIHGTHLQIVDKLSERKLKLMFRHKQTYGMKAFFKGDTLNFVHPKTLQIYGEVIVKAVDSVSEREVEITLKTGVPRGFKVGDYVENVTWTPSVLIKDNYFSGTNTRGILLTTRRKSIIENNTFYRTGMHAILIADDAENWYESGPVSDVLIKGNTFIDCGYNKSPDSYVINIWPENRKNAPDYYVHQHITIENNRFLLFDSPVLRAKSTKNLIFRKNTIEMTDSFLSRKKGKPSFYFSHCFDVKLMDNHFENTTFETLKYRDMKKEEIHIDDKNIKFIK